MIQSWTSRAVPVFAGQRDSHIKTGEDYDTRTLAEIFTMEPGAQPKAKGLAFVPSTHRDHDARCHTVQRECGQFVALTGDIDEGDHPRLMIAGLVHQFSGGSAALIYSSPHARPGNQRWRIIMPLDVPVPFATWHDAQTAFFNFMEIRGVVMDHALARAGQPVYLPNVPAAHDKSGEALRGPAGAPLYYQRHCTGLSAPGLRLDVGFAAAGLADLELRREADDRKRECLRAEANRRRASRPQEEGESPIVRFNRANSLSDLLVSYRYEQSPRNPDDWRSPLQTGATYATRVVGAKWVSLSGSDTAAEIGAQCATGCYGDAFDLFVHFEHGGNRTAALRQLHHEHKAALAYAAFGGPYQFEGAR